jgi:hypothetical protein
LCVSSFRSVSSPSPLITIVPERLASTQSSSSVVEEEVEEEKDYYPEGARPPWYEVPKIKKRMLKDLKKSPCSGTSFFNHPNYIFTNMIEECTVCSTIWTQVSYHE